MTTKREWIEALVEAGCEKSVAEDVVNAVFLAGSQTRKDRAASGEYSEQFEVFWKSFPRDPAMSKKEAWIAWKRLGEGDRERVASAVPKYIAWLAEQRQKKADYPTVHACRFISQRRFEGFSEDSKAPAINGHGIYLEANSAQLDAWEKHMKATRGRGLPRDKKGGWWVPTEWPPQVEVTA